MTRTVALVIVVVVIAGAVLAIFWPAVWVALKPWWDTREWQYWLLAFVLGGTVGASELISRYRDEPYIAITNRYGGTYLSLNGGISLLAYMLLRQYSSKIFPDLADDRLLSSIVAGFGAMVIMRSKLFNFKTEGGENFAVGPDAVISTILSSVDRLVDRTRSAVRQKLVYDEVVKIKAPDTAPRFLEVYLAAFQNLSQSEKAELKTEIERITNNKDLSEQLKLMALAFGFLNLTGERNFRSLMDQLANYETHLKNQNQPPSPPPPAPPAPPAPTPTP